MAVADRTPVAKCIKRRPGAPSIIRVASDQVAFITVLNSEKISGKLWLAHDLKYKMTMSFGEGLVINATFPTEHLGKQQ